MLPHRLGLIASAALATFFLTTAPAAAQERSDDEQSWAADLARRRAAAAQARLSSNLADKKKWHARKIGRVQTLTVPKQKSWAKRPLQATKEIVGWLDDAIGGWPLDKPDLVILRLGRSTANVGVTSWGYSWSRGDVSAPAALKYQALTQGLIQATVDQRCEGLWSCLPPWITGALDDMSRTALVTSRKGFGWSYPNKAFNTVYPLVRGSDPPSVHHLMKGEQLLGLGADQQRATAHLFLRFLSMGKGRVGRSERLLGRIIEAVGARVMIEHEKRWFGQMKRALAGQPALTFQEKAALFTTWEQQVHSGAALSADRKKAIWIEAFDEVFDDWKDAHWDTFEKNFREYVRSKKRVR